MLVFYDPSAQNQIMAVYTGDTKSPVWEEHGYLRAEVWDGVTVSRERRVLTFIGGRVAETVPRPNPVQPQPNAQDFINAARRARLQAAANNPTTETVMLDLLALQGIEKE